MSSLI